MLRVIVGEGAESVEPSPVRLEDLAWETMDIGELEALAATPALFGDVRGFRLVGVWGSARAEEFFVLAPLFAASPHLFVCDEEKLLKGPTEQLTRAGAEIIVRPLKKKERAFDEFGVTGALAAGDKKKLWLGIVRALAAGERPEAVSGLLLWKARDLVVKAPAAKRERALGTARALLAMYHESHRGGGDLALLLERFALAL